jgi:Plasmid pRiA4b ORF-3-like protein
VGETTDTYDRGKNFLYDTKMEKNCAVEAWPARSERSEQPGEVALTGGTWARACSICYSVSSGSSMAYEEPIAVQIHAVLDVVAPPIWRRLVVPLTFNLKHLHHVLQAAFGWTDSHLHEYRIGGLRFGDADFAESERFEGDMRTFEEADVTLNDFSREPGTKF